MAELEIGRLARRRGAAAAGRVRSIAFRPCLRDLSLLCDEALRAEDLLATVRTRRGKRPCASWRSATATSGDPVPQGRVSLTVGLRFQEAGRTLTGEEVQAAVDEVTLALRSAGAEIRGEAGGQIVENAFDLLEERVRRAADALRRLQGENAELKKQLSRAQGALQQAEKAMEAAEKQKASAGPSAEERRKMEALAEEAAALRREREEVRVRMARIVEILDGLD